MKSTPTLFEFNQYTGPIDPKMAKVIDEALDLYEKFPEIGKCIAADQTEQALEEKKQRIADARWQRERDEFIIPGFEVIDNGTIREELVLQQGRPRMDPKLVFVFLILRGYYGGIDNDDVWSRFIDSMTLNTYLAELEVKQFPGQSTIRENVNTVSNETRELILRCQLAQVVDLELDDFKTLYIDSTHVHANSAWPTDSGLILKLLERAYKLGHKLSEFDLPNFRHFRTKVWLKKLRTIDFEINCAKTKKERNSLYKKFLNRAEDLENRLSKEFDHLTDEVDNADLLPSRKQLLSMHWEFIFDSLRDAAVLREVAYRRTVNGEEVTREDFEKIFSVSDRSAAFIKKGGRETAFGYRPQLGRSANGFITSVIVPEGNIADSDMLIPAVQAHLSSTSITPKAVSTDDGYASAVGRQGVFDLGVEAVSINGSKGKKLTSEEEWESGQYSELRRYRSAAESLMFVGKFSFRFGEFSRRGIEAVRAEMLEKVIAHNFWRIGHEQEKCHSAAETAA